MIHSGLLLPVQPWLEVLIALGSAMGLTSYMVDAQIPMSILSFMKIIHSKYVFLILLNIFF